LPSQQVHDHEHCAGPQFVEAKQRLQQNTGTKAFAGVANPNTLATIAAQLAARVPRKLRRFAAFSSLSRRFTDI
jgi:hypothetical protein